MISHNTETVAPSLRAAGQYERSKQMNIRRITALIIGVLYLVGTVAGVLSVALTNPILGTTDYLARVAADENAVITGSLLILTMGLALALIPVVAYPILKEHNEALAIGYVVFRGGLETVTYIALVIAWMGLVPLSRGVAPAGAPAAHVQALADLVLRTGETAFTLTAIIFPLGALMFYYLLYQAKLIPRWISGWGLITAIPYLASGVLAMFGLVATNSLAESVLRLPLGLQELVMALWLIGKGFTPSAQASAPADLVARHQPDSTPTFTPSA